MSIQQSVNRGTQWLGVGAGVAAIAYAGYAAATWWRYGHPAPSADSNPGLDRFMPVYDVVDRHSVRVEAPAETTLAAAKELRLTSLPLVRAIFEARARLMGASAAGPAPARGILSETLALGWVILEETRGREIVVGAVTRPWEADVTFRSIPPALFAGFNEPGYVKIVWNLRADPIGDRASIFRTETRALATDAWARTKFRAYWAFLSPGIRLIRRLSLAPLKAEAERDHAH